MTFFFLSLSLFTPILLGYLIIYLLFDRKPFPFWFHISLSYGLGIGIVSQWILLLGILNIPYNRQTLSLPLLSIIMLLFLWAKKKAPQKNQPHIPEYFQKNESFDLLCVFLICYIGFNVLYVLWYVLCSPISVFDVYSNHAFNAKIIFFEKSLKLHHNFPHYSYPYFLPFLQAWIAFHLGFWEESVLKYIPALAFISFLIGQYYLYQKFTNKRWALFGVALPLSSYFFVFHATTALRDFLMLYYNCWTIMLLLFWSLENKNSWIYLAALFSGFTSFIKLEGAGYLLVHIIILLILLFHKKQLNGLDKLKKLIKFIIPSVSIFLFYFLYKRFIVTPRVMATEKYKFDFNFTDLELGFSYEHVIQGGIVLKRIAENLFVSANWNLIWFLLCVSLLIKNQNTCIKTPLGKERNIMINTLLLSLIMYFGIYFIGYTFTQHSHWVTNTDTVLSRCILHFMPIATMLITLINCPLISSKR